MFLKIIHLLYYYKEIVILKSLYWILDIGYNDIFNYHANYSMRKCFKKQPRINRTAGLLAFWLQHLKKLQQTMSYCFQVFLSNITRNLGSPVSLHLKTSQIFYLLQTFIMLWRTIKYAIDCLVETVLNLGHTSHFSQMDNIWQKRAFRVNTFLDKDKIVLILFEFIFSNFLLNSFCNQNIFLEIQHAYNLGNQLNQ